MGSSCKSNRHISLRDLCPMSLSSTACCVLAWLLFGIALAAVSPAQAAKIYWTDTSSDKVQSSNLDGSNVQDIVTTGLISPQTLAVDQTNGQFYVSDEGTDEITRYELDGSGSQTILSQPTELSAIDVDPDSGQLYFANRSVNGSSSNRSVQRANLDGTGIVSLVTTSTGGVRFMALDLVGGKMYWTDESIGVRRANLDGSALEIIVSQGGGIRGIALDLTAGKVYWANGGVAPVGDGMLQRADLNGSSVETLVTGIDPVGLDLFEGQMYWTDPVAGKIQSANLDGSALTDLITAGLSVPSGLKIVQQIPEPGTQMLGFGALIAFVVCGKRGRE